MNKDEIFNKDKLVFPDDRNINFKNKEEVCNLFGINVIKRGYQEQSFYRLNDSECLWLIKESTEYENGYIDDFYQDYIKEIREYNQKEFVLDVLKRPNDIRYVFLKTLNGYEFFGTYMLDVDRSNKSLDEDIPTRYWNRVSNEVIINRGI